MEIPCVGLQRRETRMDPGNSLRLNYSITAVRWLGISTMLLKTNLSDCRCDDTFILQTHLSAQRCPISFSSQCFLWACNFWREASEASNARITPSMSGFGFITPSAAVAADKPSICIVSECGTGLFRQHPRRKFDLFMSNTVKGLACQITPSQVYSLIFNMWCGIQKENIFTWKTATKMHTVTA